MEIYLYLTGFFNNISVFFELFSIILFVISVVGWGVYLVHYIDGEITDEFIEKMKNSVIFISKCFIFCLFISIVTPNKKTMYLMLAANQGGKLVNQTSKNQTYNKFIQVLDKKMDEYLTENKGNKK